MDIKIKAKLKAYTKGIIPTKNSQIENDSDYVVDVQDLEHLYVRKKGEWIILDKEEVEAGNGINVNRNYEDNIHTYTVSARQVDIARADFDRIPVAELEDDTTYFVIEEEPVNAIESEE